VTPLNVFAREAPMHVSWAGGLLKIWQTADAAENVRALCLTVTVHQEIGRRSHLTQFSGCMIGEWKKWKKWNSSGPAELDHTLPEICWET